MKLLNSGLFTLTPEEIKILEDMGFEVIVERSEAVKFPFDVSDIDVMFCARPFNANNLDDFKSLKYVHTRMAGVNGHPIEEIRARGIEFGTGIGAYGKTISEWVIMGLLHLYKDMDHFEDCRDRKFWPPAKSFITEMYGRTACILGTGDIGLETARKLKAFDVHTIGVNRTIHADSPWLDEQYTVDRLDEILPRCDIVAVSTPLTDETFHMIGKRQFELMKPTAIITNIARGAIIDEQAMVEALQNGVIGGAVLDAFEQEPLPQESPLWEMKNVVLTPHNSFRSDLVDRRIFQIALEGLKDFLARQK